MRPNTFHFPKEWPFVSIGDLVTEFRGGAPLKPSDFTDTGVKVLPKGGVGRKGWLDIEDEDLQYCSPEYAERNHRNSVDEKYTIVVLRDLVPSGPSIGLMVQIEQTDKYVLAQGVYGFKLKQDVVPGFLVQLSNTNWYRKLANSIMVGSTQVHITNTAFKSIQLPLPPFPEQEAIAHALSNADALIESLEQLLAKKRHLKLGIMQELLTGKRRLPGFSGRWELKLIEELEQDHWIRLSRGKVISKKDIELVPGDFPIYSSSVTDAGMFGCYGDYMFDEELITWSVDGGGHFFHRPKHKFSVTNVCGYIRLETSRLSYQFVAAQLQLLHSQMKFDYQDKAHPSIIRKAYRLCIPPLEEQEAIAAVFFEIDAEIANLDAQLAKTRALKKGMMQKLLTGEIRLI